MWKFALLALLSACALAAAQDESLEEAQKRVEELKRQKAEDAELSRPQIYTDKGGINIRVARDADTKFSRQTTEEASLFGLAESITQLEKDVAETAKVQASVDAELKALTTMVEAVVPTIERIDELVDKVKEANTGMAKVAAEVAKIDDKIAAKVNPLQASVDTQFKDATKKLNTVTTKLTEKADELVTKTVPTKLAAAKAASDKITTALSASVAAAVKAAGAAGADSIYTQYGRRKCTGPSGKTQPKKLFDGWLYGSRHNYNGGGGKSICLKNEGGNHGGHGTGGDSADLIYPIRTDHCGYTGGTVWDRNCGDLIPCSRCYHKGKQCYLERGIEGCSAEGYSVQYKGTMWGAHYGHHGNVDRFCMDQAADNGDWPVHDNYNGYVYPTIHRGNVRNRNGQNTVHCSMCCQDDRE